MAGELVSSGDRLRREGGLLLSLQQERDADSPLPRHDSGSTNTCCQSSSSFGTHGTTRRDGVIFALAFLSSLATSADLPDVISLS